MNSVDGHLVRQNRIEFSLSANNHSRMPRMNGYEFASAAREVEAKHKWPASRIVAITGNGSSDSLSKETAIHTGSIDKWLVSFVPPIMVCNAVLKAAYCRSKAMSN